MNKKLTLILVALIGCFSVKAQTQKGNQLIGGSIGFGITNGSSDYTNYYNSLYNYSYKSKDVYFSVGPVYSYFIADHLDLGTSLGYSTEKTTYNYSVFNTNYNALPSKSTSQNYFAGLYLRKYFLYKQKLGIRTGPFAEYQKYKYQYQYLEPQINNNNFTQSGNAINTGLILDFVYFPIKRIGITSTLGTLGYVHEDAKVLAGTSNNNGKIDSFGFRLVSNLNLSIVYSFGKSL